MEHRVDSVKSNTASLVDGGWRREADLLRRHGRPSFSQLDHRLGIHQTVAVAVTHWQQTHAHASFSYTGRNRRFNNA